MEAIHREIRDRALAAAEDPNQNTGEAAIRLLREWSEGQAATPPERGQRASTEFNGTMMQWFHWYLPSDGEHWNRLQAQAADLARVGITGLWLPPAGKGIGGVFDVGYGIYDLFDLGEFDQKGTVRTKYGTKDQYIGAVKCCQESGIQVYADAVLNHRMAADDEEEFNATPSAPDNRYHVIGEKRRIRSWTSFTFPGRQGIYSGMEWHWWHFDAVDYNSWDPNFRAVWRIEGREFDGNVDLEKGNYDYLMGCDLDIDNAEVRLELKRWGEWILEHVGVDGFRIDAIRHISSNFFSDWIDHLEQEQGRDLFVVGEYWTYNLATLRWYAANTNGRMHLFDAPLHLNFHSASKAGGTYDMRRILDGSLMQSIPLLAVTLVENHDTQPLQALESVVEDWFKPLAYAIILLRRRAIPAFSTPTITAPAIATRAGTATSTTSAW